MSNLVGNLKDWFSHNKLIWVCQLEAVSGVRWRGQRGVWEIKPQTGHAEIN